MALEQVIGREKSMMAVPEVLSRVRPAVIAAVVFGLVCAVNAEQLGESRGTVAGQVTANTQEAVLAYFRSHPTRLLSLVPRASLRRVGGAGRQPGTYAFEYYIDGARVMGIGLLAWVDDALTLRLRESYPTPLAVNAPRTPLLNDTQIRAKALAAVPGSTVLDEPEQVWMHTPEGFRRGARTVLTPTGRAEEWELVLDATDGSVLRRVDRLQREGVRP
jgi:hypothetical protein